ncbi:hypothetical protein PC118_g22338 [Phytophthora cactorum]|uniref:Uncharacterized protein n=2 Tax=Phytophthora cactorum TaxID=29920 RepID=A0A8T1ESI2_9STRA|nr:hypothetical protein PC117_g24787 [Phytophthora cactorum]KAG2960772.1 hypothetical protein PC118_g22338 [Phytophthora cactorum]KAG2967010.1 hypothetical protein PC119_g24587 [Phytophthora cactorum]
MAEAPPGQKRKRDEPSGTRKRRSVRSSVEGVSAETASSLGSVAVFTDAWGALVNASWTSKQPPSKCLGSRYIYIRPGGRHDGKGGGGYLFDELPSLGSLWVCAWVELLQNKGPRQEASMTLQIRPSSLSATSKEPVTKKRQSLLVQQAGVDVGAGSGGAAGQVVVARREARGGRGGRAARRAASTEGELKPMAVRWAMASACKSMELLGRQSVLAVITVVPFLPFLNCIALTLVKNPDWRILVRPDPTDESDFEEDDSDGEEEEVIQVFDPTEILPTSLAEIEAIRSMRFVPFGDVERPSYLYQHRDGPTQTYLRPEFKHLFEHSASSSCFAYIPPLLLAPSAA